MKKSIKILLIVSLTINFVFIISGTVVAVKAWSFKKHYLGDSHRGNHHQYGKEKKKGKHNKNILYFLKENEKIKKKLRDMNQLRREAKEMVKEREQSLSLEEIKTLLERLENEVITLTQVTHQEIYAELENMSEEQRKQTIDFLFKRR